MVFITFLKLFYIFPFIFLICIKITAPHEKHFLLRSSASLVSMPEPCWILASRLEGNLNGEKKGISLINSFHLISIVSTLTHAALYPGFHFHHVIIFH